MNMVNLNIIQEFIYAVGKRQIVNLIMLIFIVISIIIGLVRGNIIIFIFFLLSAFLIGYYRNYIYKWL